MRIPSAAAVIFTVLLGCKGHGVPTSDAGAGTAAAEAASAPASSNTTSAPPVASSTANDLTATSICANVDAWALNSLDRGFLDCSEMQHAVEAKDDAKIRQGIAGCTRSLAELSSTVKRVLNDPKMDVGTRKRIFAETTDFDDQVASLQGTLATIRPHPATPGEEVVKKGLIADYETVIATYKRWASIIRRYDGSSNRIEAEVKADFGENLGLGLIDHVSVNEGLRYTKCLELERDGGASASVAAPSTEDAGGVAAMARSLPGSQAAGPRVIQTSCPSGQKAFLHLFRAGPAQCFCGDPNSGHFAPNPRSNPDLCGAYATKGSDCLWKCP